MTKIDIISGFLGAGKTTLIKKLINEAYKGEKIVLIENEFGEIGIDGGFLKDAGIEITEMNSGCICCSLVGDFTLALAKVLEDYNPDRIVIEPSGVGKLSDVIEAVKKVTGEEAELCAKTTVVDAFKAKMHIKNFGEFFCDQLSCADTIILSHTGKASDQKVEECVSLLREFNEDATIVTTDWDVLTGEQILDAMQNKNKLSRHLHEMEEEEHHHHHDHDEECECECHEHHHHDHDEECECGCHEHHHEHHHHDHDEECECGCHEHHHGHHHHDHDEECECGCHEHHHEHHHHDHDEECECGCHEHHHGHHHHHHADDVFTSIGKETTKKFTLEFITNALKALSDQEKYGLVLRAKGIVAAEDGKFIHFDYIPEEPDVRFGTPDIIGRICVIGTKLNEEAICELFGV